MLDPNALAQLNALKTEIQASKDYAEGIVAATSGRFGFVRTDDGRDVFLSPEKMDRLLPGDRVKVSVTENDKGKLEGELESLLNSDIKKFVGQYRVKGAGHFAVPSGPQFNRWIFIPPSQRKGAKEGDYVVVKMSRHPWKDGKAQANVVFRIGQPSDPFIEHKYTKAKYELNYRSTDGHQKHTDTIQAQFEKGEFGDKREDLRALPFCTIDAATTLDMDDALAIEKTDTGYRLHVAIADPGFAIAPDSPLGTQARTCGQSVYLLGGTVPMLPVALAHHAFSLEAGKDKPALVFSLEINQEGQVTDSQFRKALIQSRHKLSYDVVAALIENNETADLDEDTQAQLHLLAEASQCLRNHREQHGLVSDDHGDYEYQLDERGHIVSIDLRTRNAAQQIVEEAMIATNIAAGAQLQANGCGLHTVHQGFREDRIGEVRALLKEEGIEAEDINSLEGHIALMRTLQQDEQKQRLIPALRRMMQPSELSPSAGPHLGMGLPNYATITSPIRRFADLFNHWCLSAIANGEDAPKLDEATLQTLNETLRNGRQADRELQQWLLCLHTEKLAGTLAKGKVRIVTQQGFGVKIHDTGIEGFVLFPKKTEKQFDAKRMTLTVADTTYFIGQELEIKIGAVDHDKRRIAFELA